MGPLIVQGVSTVLLAAILGFAFLRAVKTLERALERKDALLKEALDILHELVAE